MEPEPNSVDLLQRTYAGDREALEELVTRHRDWLWGYVRKKMSRSHRAFEASEDVVQDIVRKLLERGPAFVPRNEDEFRLFVATIVMNRLRDRHDWIHAERRDKDREVAITKIGDAGKSGPGVATKVAEADEKARQQQLLALALELVAPEDASLIRSIRIEQKSYREIGESLGLEASAVRMRCRRAETRLGRMMRQIEAGDTSELEERMNDLDGSSE